ncbi:hypothetical protein [Cylindrospermopsis raciborskii]|nr:hypothetical protein [Cylindrospermopsis raciborskii]MCZ2207996.1 hypothetical protein [Cylindrospermopsis raciborskii PAMP2011]
MGGWFGRFWNVVMESLTKRESEGERESVCMLDVEKERERYRES